jgi:hypothetical protein
LVKTTTIWRNEDRATLPPGISSGIISDFRCQIAALRRSLELEPSTTESSRLRPEIPANQNPGKDTNLYTAFWQNTSPATFMHHSQSIYYEQYATHWNRVKTPKIDFQDRRNRPLYHPSKLFVLSCRDFRRLLPATGPRFFARINRDGKRSWRMRPAF